MKPNHVIEELNVLAKSIERAKRPSAVKAAAHVRNILSALKLAEGNPHLEAIYDLIIDYAKKNKLTLTTRSTIYTLVEKMFVK